MTQTQAAAMDQDKPRTKNLWTAFILASIAVAFALGYVARRMLG